MENDHQHEQIDEESQEGQILDEIPVQLEESYETVGLSTSNSSNIVRGKYYKQTYRQAWESMPDFKGWLRGVVGEPTRAYCTYCQKTLHAHRLSLLKHTCTIRHQKAAQIHNSRKNKPQNMEQQEIHTVVLQEDEISQQEIENEDGDTVEYAEVGSELEDDENNSKDNQDGGDDDDDDDEVSMELHQVPFGRSGSHFQGIQLKAPISTTVVDVARGCPVTGLQVSLYKLIDGRWTYINEGVTDCNGRFSNFVNCSDFTTGRYKLHYDVDRYFDARKQDTLYPFIEIILDCKSVTDTYNIPLQLSPYGFATHKGP